MEKINLIKSKSEEMFPEKLLMDMTPRKVDSVMFRCFADENGWNLTKTNEFDLTSPVRQENSIEKQMEVCENSGLRTYLLSVWNGFWRRNSKKNLKKIKNDFHKENTAVEITSV